MKDPEEEDPEAEDPEVEEEEEGDGNGDGEDTPFCTGLEREAVLLAATKEDGVVDEVDAVLLLGDLPWENYRAPPRPRQVAAFMSAHSKTPYITPSMEFSSGKGVVRRRRVQQLAFTLELPGPKRARRAALKSPASISRDAWCMDAKCT